MGTTWFPSVSHMGPTWFPMGSRSNFSHGSHMVPTWFPQGPTRIPHGTHMVPTCVPRGSHVSFFSRVVSMVKQFYERNDTSALLPGMKDFISVRNESGEKQKVQKRLLLLNLKELYQLFKEEHSDEDIGFTKFSLLRPKHCVLAGTSGTHSICVYPYHQNVKLMKHGESVFPKLLFKFLKFLIFYLLI